MVEAKSLRDPDELAFRVSRKQRHRLLFARSFWQDQMGRPVVLKFAFVTPSSIVVLEPQDFDG
jgi:hypothetical protein